MTTTAIISGFLKFRSARSDSRHSALSLRHILVTFFARKENWKTAFVYCWRREQHINALEAAAYVLLILWAVSHNICRKTVVFFLDSRGVIGTFSKGRSSPEDHCLSCRQAGALCPTHFPGTYGVSRCKNLGIIYNLNEILLSSSSVSI